MKTIKYILFSAAVIFFAVNIQSCKRLIWGASKYSRQYGYITDTLGNGISKVKMKLYKSEEYDGELEETDYIFYTDKNGYYDIEVKNGIYYIDMTHPDYIYPVRNNSPYPQLYKGGEPYEDTNYQMVKKGPVKIKGYIMCDEDSTYWIDSVKISVLKRPVGNANYPDTTGIYTYTNENGYYYIEYEGNENYEFFLKPEKNGYYYEWRDFDYAPAPNTDPGYIYPGSIKIKKIN
ncbi:MAG: hypothetical protein L3J35_06520 [Bacteroidales bacterium]|nr:hypothetical protein [Bacteroidales bacterium]